MGKFKIGDIVELNSELMSDSWLIDDNNISKIKETFEITKIDNYGVCYLKYLKHPQNIFECYHEKWLTKDIQYIRNKKIDNILKYD